MLTKRHKDRFLLPPPHTNVVDSPIPPERSLFPHKLRVSDRLRESRPDHTRCSLKSLCSIFSGSCGDFNSFTRSEMTPLSDLQLWIYSEDVCHYIRTVRVCARACVCVLIGCDVS